VEPGVSVVQTLKSYAKSGFVLPMNVDATPITIGGAVSVGANGFSKKHRPYSDFVSEIELVDGNGTLKTINKKKNCEQMRSVSCSLGLCGIIHQNTIETCSGVQSASDYQEASCQERIEQHPKIYSKNDKIFPRRCRLRKSFLNVTRINQDLLIVHRLLINHPKKINFGVNCMISLIVKRDGKPLQMRCENIYNRCCCPLSFGSLVLVYYNKNTLIQSSSPDSQLVHPFSEVFSQFSHVDFCHVLYSHNLQQEQPQTNTNSDTVMTMTICGFVYLPVLEQLNIFR